MRSFQTFVLAVITTLMVLRVASESIELAVHIRKPEHRGRSVGRFFKWIKMIHHRVRSNPPDYNCDCISPPQQQSCQGGDISGVIMEIKNIKNDIDAIKIDVHHISDIKECLERVEEKLIHYDSNSKVRIEKSYNRINKKIGKNIAKIRETIEKTHDGFDNGRSSSVSGGITEIKSSIQEIGHIFHQAEASRGKVDSSLFPTLDGLKVALTKNSETLNTILSHVKAKPQGSEGARDGGGGGGCGDGSGGGGGGGGNAGGCGSCSSYEMGQIKKAHLEVLNLMKSVITTVTTNTKEVQSTVKGGSIGARGATMALQLHTVIKMVASLRENMDQMASGIRSRLTQVFQRSKTYRKEIKIMEESLVKSTQLMNAASRAAMDKSLKKPSSKCE